MKAARQLSEVAWDDRHVSFGQLIHNDGAFEAYPVADPAETIAVLQYTGDDGTAQGRDAHAR